MAGRPAKICIVVYFKSALSPEDYSKNWKTADIPRPESCPGCLHSDIVAHAWYERWFRNMRIGIRLWLCNNCSVTISSLPIWMARRVSESVTTIAEFVRLRESGASFREAAAQAGMPNASYQRLQYWVRRIRNIRGRIRGFVDWTWNFIVLRKKLLAKKYIFGPLSLSRAP